MALRAKLRNVQDLCGAVVSFVFTRWATDFRVEFPPLTSVYSVASDTKLSVIGRSSV